MEYRRGKRIDDPQERAMRRAYTNQRSRAKGLGIAFEFTFEQWREWWQREWDQRGRNYKQFVMAGIDERGPFKPGNVKCITQSQNSLRRSPPVWWKTAHPKAHLGMRGAAHPASRSVRTPAGIFESATMAGEAFEISRQHAARLAREQRDGWDYIDD